MSFLCVNRGVIKLFTKLTLGVCNNYTATSIGFRPLVCLKSNILINWIEDENIYEIKNN